MWKPNSNYIKGNWRWVMEDSPVTTEEGSARQEAEYLQKQTGSENEVQNSPVCHPHSSPLTQFSWQSGKVWMMIPYELLIQKSDRKSVVVKPDHPSHQHYWGWTSPTVCVRYIL
jgi:hypothetical protein